MFVMIVVHARGTTFFLFIFFLYLFFHLFFYLFFTILFAFISQNSNFSMTIFLCANMCRNSNSNSFQFNRIHSPILSGRVRLSHLHKCMCWITLFLLYIQLSRWIMFYGFDLITTEYLVGLKNYYVDLSIRPYMLHVLSAFVWYLNFF